jgi:hypothetical protein
MSGPFTYPGVVGVAREGQDRLVITVGFGPDDTTALMTLAEAIARGGLPDGVVRATVRTEARGPRAREWDSAALLATFALREKARADALQARVRDLEADLERARLAAE